MHIIWKTQRLSTSCVECHYWIIYHHDLITVMINNYNLWFLWHYLPKISSSLESISKIPGKVLIGQKLNCDEWVDKQNMTVTQKNMSHWFSMRQLHIHNDIQWQQVHMNGKSLWAMLKIKGKSGKGCKVLSSLSQCSQLRKESHSVQ